MNNNLFYNCKYEKERKIKIKYDGTDQSFAMICKLTQTLCQYANTLI